MKTIVVTDIHGCLEELESVWAQAGFDPETDKLICLGDLMDRGPYSFECSIAFATRPAGRGGAVVIYDFWSDRGDAVMNSFRQSSGLCANGLRNRGGWPRLL